MGFEDWPQKRISVKSIDLDPQNPRFPDLPSDVAQPALRQELLEHGNVMDLVRGIAEQGYYPDQPVIVIRTDQRRFTVIEGNRRVCACRFLTDRRTIPPKYRARLERLAENAAPHQQGIAKIPVVVAPAREAAWALIASKHMASAPLEKWSVYSQGRFAAELLTEGRTLDDVLQLIGLTKTELRNVLTRYRLIETILALDWTDSEYQLLSERRDDFPVEAIQRLLRNPATRGTIGSVTVDDEGWMHFSWKKEDVGPFLKHIAKAAMPREFPDIPRQKTLTTRTVGDKESAEKWLKTIPPELIPERQGTKVSGREFHDAAPSRTVSAAADNKSNSAPEIRSKRPPNRRAAGGYLEWALKTNIQNQKLRALVKETNKFSPSDSPHAFGLLLRTLLEIALVVRLKHAKHWGNAYNEYGVDGQITLDSMLRYATQDKNFVTDASLRKTIPDVRGKIKPILNLTAHNEQHALLRSELKEAAQKVLPLLTWLLE